MRKELVTSEPYLFYKNLPFYYGWVVMPVATLGIIMSSPGQTFIISLFIEHFIADLTISRSLVSTLYSVATIAGSLALPYVGKQIDRRGSRLVMAMACAALGLACFYMGWVRSALMLAVGFVFLRMLGQGALGLVSKTIINLWWIRRRGTINGISGFLMATIGAGGVPILVAWLIEQNGWQITYMIFGAVLLVGFLPVSWLLIRDTPEAVGLQPDGEDVSKEEEEADILIEEHWTRYEAIRTSAFWLLALGLASIAMLSTGLFFHMVSIFKDNNLGTAEVALAFMPIAASMAIVNLVSGILADRIPVRFLLAFGLLCLSCCLILAQFLSNELLILIYGSLLGTTLGLHNTVNSVGWANYFGRLYLGSIVGLGATIIVVGSAIGPLPFGYARDLLGSYNTTLTISAAIPLLLALGNLLVLPPSRSHSG